MAKAKKYEDAVQRLQEIVESLETKDETLENSMKLFEEGVALSAFCYEKLAKAEQKVIEFAENKENIQEDADE
jgi:Exonuclease VII small subunit